jgi:hypothetical protein
MPIVYYLDYPCAVKQVVRPGRMLRLLYARDVARDALLRAREQNPQIDAADVRMELSLKDEGGKGRLVSATAAEVAEQYYELEVLKQHCSGCRANILSADFGCRARINFPFSLKAEKLLMRRVRHSSGDPTATMLANYFENNGITGNRAASMRNLPGVFFESDKPLVRRLDDGRRVSSNQVFELFFQHGVISPKHARFLLGMLDLVDFALPVGPPLQELPNLFVVEKEDAGVVVGRVGLRFSELDSEPGTRQLQQFLGGLLLASELGHEIWVKHPN